MESPPIRLYLLVMSASMVNVAKTSAVCEIKDVGTERFQIAKHCFEIDYGPFTWDEAYDYCKSNGGLLAKLDEDLLTDVTAKEVVKSIDLRLGTNIRCYVGFTTRQGKAPVWIDGTRVSTPHAEYLYDSGPACGVLILERNLDNGIKYSWMALPCAATYGAFCQYDSLIETTTELASETTTQTEEATTTDATTGAQEASTRQKIFDPTTGIPVATTTDVPVDTTTDVHVDTTTDVHVDATTAIPVHDGQITETVEQSSLRLTNDHLTRRAVLLSTIKVGSSKTMSKPDWLISGQSVVDCGGVCSSKVPPCEAIVFDRTSWRCMGYNKRAILFNGDQEIKPQYRFFEALVI